MSALCVPLDLELLPEFGQLKTLLARERPPGGTPQSNERTVEAVAELILGKLNRKLGYLARSTNKPGVLTAIGAQQFRDSLDPMFGEGCDPIKLLVDSGWLVPENNEWRCPSFATLNPHLAGDFRKPHLKGNDGRQASLAVQKAAVNGSKQAEFLPEFFKPAAEGQKGGRYEGAELQRLMIIIGSIDAILQFNRNKTGYDNALMNAAARVAERCGYISTSLPEEYRDFLAWVNGRKGTPVIPSSTEEILTQFETLYASFKGH